MYQIINVLPEDKNNLKGTILNVLFLQEGEKMVADVPSIHQKLVTSPVVTITENFSENIIKVKTKHTTYMLKKVN